MMNRIVLREHGLMPDYQVQQEQVWSEMGGLQWIDIELIEENDDE